jgi:hypothetical protein
MIESRIKYIHENPIRAGWVENLEDYLYSSARNYSGMKGLIEVDYWLFDCLSQLKIGTDSSVELQIPPSLNWHCRTAEEYLRLRVSDSYSAWVLDYQSGSNSNNGRYGEAYKSSTIGISFGSPLGYSRNYSYTYTFDLKRFVLGK